MPNLSRRLLLSAGGALALAPSLSLAQTPPDTGPAWDLGDLFPSPQAWTAEHDAVAAALPGLQRYHGRLGDSAEALRTALVAMDELNRRVQRLSLYAQLAADADTRVASAQERRELATDLATDLASATSWVDPELIALGPAKIDAFIAADAGLAPYRFPSHDVLRLAPHTLGPEAEKVLAASSSIQDAPERVRDQLVSSDIPWRTITLSTGPALIDDQGFTAHRTSPVRADRKATFDALFGEYAQFKTSLGVSLVAEIQTHTFNASSRKYGGALEAALSEHNVPTGVYRTLIAEAHAGLPQLHRYFDVRRRLLGLKEMRYYDIYPPITHIDRRFTLAEMRSLTLQAVQPLGAAYVDALAKATAAKWMDPRPRRGKASGAYEDDAYGVHPYLLLNLTDDYESLTTFAHEWGHAMHSVLADRAQPFATAGYPIFTGEIASTNNEQLLNHLMVAGARTRAEKLFYLDQLLELFRGTFFRQTMFAEFELLIHEAAEKGEGLSGDKFSEMYLALLKTYHGPGVVIDDAYAVEWAYIPHFYYNFYVYQYATSIAASAYFSDRTLAQGPKAAASYLEVLKAGGSDYPVDILKRAGLDMTSPTPYRALVAKFARTLDAMEAAMAGPG